MWGSAWLKLPLNTFYQWSFICSILYGETFLLRADVHLTESGFEKHKPNIQRGLSRNILTLCERTQLFTNIKLAVFINLHVLIFFPSTNIVYLLWSVVMCLRYAILKYIHITYFRLDRNGLKTTFLVILSSKSHFGWGKKAEKRGLLFSKEERNPL